MIELPWEFQHLGSQSLTRKNKDNIDKTRKNQENIDKTRKNQDNIDKTRQDKCVLLKQKFYYKTKIFRTKMKIFLPIIIIRNKHTNKLMTSLHYGSNKQTKQKYIFKQNINKQMIKQTIKQFNIQT